MDDRPSTALLSPEAWRAMAPWQPRQPVVADANALFQDTVRRARDGFTVLSFLAEQGSIALFSVDHVPAKARARLPKIAADMRVDENLVMETWTAVHEPLTRFVDVPATMCAGDPRVTAVRDREDVPFAQLAVALGPSLLLTRDHHLHDAGIGTERWAEALVVLGSLIELELMFYGSAQLALNASYLLARSAAEGLRLLWRSPLGLGVALAAGTILLSEGKDGLTRRAQSARRTLGDAGNRALDLAEPHFERHQENRARLGTSLVAPMNPAPPDAICARALAISPRLGSRELLSALRRAGYDFEPAALEGNLDVHPSFVARDDSWELGDGLAREAVADLAVKVPS